MNHPYPLNAHQTDFLERYADWVLQTWSTRPEDQLTRLFVMTTGLAGETGEVVEQFLSRRAGREDRLELVRELGDVTFYWARIAREFGLSVTELVRAPIDPHNQAGLSRLPVSIGQVSETLKKFIRDDKGQHTLARRDRLTQAMQLVAQDLAALRAEAGLTLEEVLQANQDKLVARRAEKAARLAHEAARSWGSPVVFPTNGLRPQVTFMHREERNRGERE